MPEEKKKEGNQLEKLGGSGEELAYLQCTTMGPASGGLRNFT